MSNRVRLKDTPAPKPPMVAKPRKRIRLMLDSGAFSAWQTGKEVNLKKYIKWVQANERWLFSYVNLDVLPGELPGRPKLDAEQCAAAGDRNLQTMLDAGLERPMPVFHQFESFKWLAKMVEDGHQYIGISSHSKLPIQQRIAWLNEVFTLLCDSKGRPYVKTHGFAMGAPTLMHGYPFYTVDSTSWIAPPANGGFTMPIDPLSDPANPFNHAKVSVGTRKKTTGNHVATMAKDRLAKIDAHLIAAGAVDRAATEKSYINRAKATADVAKNIITDRAANPCRFGIDSDRRIGRVAWLPGQRPPMPAMQAVKPFKLKVFAVAWGNVMNYVLNQIDWQDRLMSYLNITDWGEEELATYVETGFPADYEYGGKN